jgi:hypothetical protein
VAANGDFGDGLNSVATKRRRRIVRGVVGEPIEAAINPFPKCRIKQGTLPSLMSSLNQFDEIDKKLIALDLADYLEKYTELGVCYGGHSQ